MVGIAGMSGHDIVGTGTWYVGCGRPEEVVELVVVELAEPRGVERGLVLLVEVVLLVGVGPVPLAWS